MADKYSAHFLSPARKYIEGLTDAERGAIAADVDVMKSGNLAGPYTKSLKGSIRELISGYHRLTYFIIKQGIYFVRGFRKKSGKTPKQEIQYAEQIRKQMK